ncbi:Rrf2 family transcriptional regulator [Limosilactobacillus sp.]|uniref:Rrf2 family transcriptional regulator n=1 Tax=Limosilactobacillus sp. TaxID=2773925 RepID=UPI003F0E15DB
MRHSTKFANAIHLLAYAFLRSDWQMSSKLIANSINTTPVTVRQLTSQLSKAGLITTKPGSGKITFNRPPKDITLLDVFNAVTDHELIERNTKTNIQCKIGKQIPAILDSEFTKIENASKDAMQEITLADIIDQIELEK